MFLKNYSFIFFSKYKDFIFYYLIWIIFIYLENKKFNNILNFFYF